MGRKKKKHRIFEHKGQANRSVSIKEHQQTLIKPKSFYGLVNTCARFTFQGLQVRMCVCSCIDTHLLIFFLSLSLSVMSSNLCRGRVTCSTGHAQMGISYQRANACSQTAFQSNFLGYQTTVFVFYVLEFFFQPVFLERIMNGPLSLPEKFIKKTNIYPTVNVY